MMSNTQSDTQLNQLEVEMDQAKEYIENSKALSRLHDNPDFRKIFLDDYFVKEASRLVLLKADPNVQEEREQKQIMAKIDAIGELRQHFSAIYGLANMAKTAMTDHEAAHEELLQEQLNEETLQ